MSGEDINLFQCIFACFIITYILSLWYPKVTWPGTPLNYDPVTSNSLRGVIICLPHPGTNDLSMLMHRKTTTQTLNRLTLPIQLRNIVWLAVCGQQSTLQLNCSAPPPHYCSHAQLTTAHSCIPSSASKKQRSVCRRRRRLVKWKHVEQIRVDSWSDVHNALFFAWLRRMCTIVLLRQYMSNWFNNWLMTQKVRLWPQTLSSSDAEANAIAWAATYSNRSVVCLSVALCVCAMAWWRILVYIYIYIYWYFSIVTVFDPLTLS